MSEYIKKENVDTLVDELARAISDERCFMSRGRSTASIMQDILDLPTYSFPDSDNKGEWEKIWRTDNMCSEYVCSKCGCGEDYCTEFCPNCGADMRGKK